MIPSNPSLEAGVSCRWWWVFRRVVGLDLTGFKNPSGLEKGEALHTAASRPKQAPKMRVEIAMICCTQQRSPEGASYTSAGQRPAMR